MIILFVLLFLVIQSSLVERRFSCHLRSFDWVTNSMRHRCLWSVSRHVSSWPAVDWLTAGACLSAGCCLWHKGTVSIACCQSFDVALCVCVCVCVTQAITLIVSNGDGGRVMPSQLVSRYKYFVVSLIDHRSTRLHVVLMSAQLCSYISCRQSVTLLRFLFISLFWSPLIDQHHLRYYTTHPSFGVVHSRRRWPPTGQRRLPRLIDGDGCRRFNSNSVSFCRIRTRIRGLWSKYFRQYSSPLNVSLSRRQGRSSSS